MNTVNKRNWMLWAIILLAVMNLSTLATILYYHYKPAKPNIYPALVHQRLFNDPQKFSGHYFRNRLNLNAEQMNKFKQINPAFREKARTINLELMLKRRQMLTELNSLKCDTNKLNALSDSIGYLHSNLKKLTYKYYLDLKGICNNTQQVQLEDLFNEMFPGDLPPNFMGKGKMGMPKHGRHQNNY